MNKQAGDLYGVRVMSMKPPRWTITPMVWLHLVVGGIALWGLAGFALRYWGGLP